MASLVAQLVKNPPAMQETWVRYLGREDPLEKGKATHSSILAWRIPWPVESMGSQRVRHGSATFTFIFLEIRQTAIENPHPAACELCPWQSHVTSSERYSSHLQSQVSA